MRGLNLVVALWTALLTPCARAWTDVPQGTLIHTGTERPVRVVLQDERFRTLRAWTVRRQIDTSSWPLGRRRVIIGATARDRRTLNIHLRPFSITPRLVATGAEVSWADLGHPAYFLRSIGPDGTTLMAAWVYANQTAVPSARTGVTTIHVSTPTGITATTRVERLDYATDRRVEPYFPFNDTTKPRIAFSWDQHAQDSAYYLQVYDADTEAAVWQGFVYDSVYALDLPLGHYKWRVKPFSVDGYWGHPSSWVTFRRVTDVDGYENLLGQDPLKPTSSDRASLLYPEDAITLPSGAILIADAMRHVLREVSGGNVRVVAGTGIGGHNGDGPALETRLNRPVGLLLQPNGKVLIADQGNFLLREYDPEAGTIRTVDGVPGVFGSLRADGTLDGPALGYMKHMAWVNGELVAAITGALVAPNGGQSLRGGLFVHRNGTFVPFAQTLGLDLREIIGFDWFGPDLWLSTKNALGSHELLRVNALGIVTLRRTLGPFSQGVIALGPDRAYVGKHTQLLEYAAGAFTVRKSGFANIAMLRREGHRLIVVDGDALRVDRVDPTNWTAEPIATNGANRFAAPVAVTAVSNSEVLVLVNQPPGIYRHDLATGATRRIAGNGLTAWAIQGLDARLSPLHYPVNLLHLPDGTILFNEQNGVWEIEPTTNRLTLVAGAPTAPGWRDGPALQARFKSVRGLRVAPDGRIFIADTGNNRVRTLHRTTQIVATVAGDGSIGVDPSRWYGRDARVIGINAPMDVLPEARGFFVVQSNRNTISWVDSNGIISRAAGADIQRGYQGVGGFAEGPRLHALFNTPVAIEPVGSGRYLVVDQFNHSVRSLDSFSFRLFGTGEAGFGPTTLNMPTAAIRVGDRTLICDAGNGLLRAAP